MTLISPARGAYPAQGRVYGYGPTGEGSAWQAIAIRDAATMREPTPVFRIRSARRQQESAPSDSLSVLRQGVLVFLAGLNLALGAALLNAGLAFLLAYCATGALLLSLLGYWRQTGRAIIAPGTLLVLIALTFVLAITSGVAAFAG